MFGKHGRTRLAVGFLLVVFVALGALNGHFATTRSGSVSRGPRPLAPQGGTTSTPELSPAEGDSAPVGSDPVPAGPNGVEVGASYKNDESPPLRDMVPLHPAPGDAFQAEREWVGEKIPMTGHKDEADTVVQKSIFTTGRFATLAPTAGLSWDGISSGGAGGAGCNCAPPDTVGDVGPNHYVQAVNSAFQVWNKTGTSLYGPANINTVWNGFGGPCQTNNDGDPVVLYDPIANRWLLSQFTASAPYNECIAISTTADPTGTWYRYAFQLSTSVFPDYPHLGVWPDGYYMSVNMFTNGETYAGPQPYVFDRTKMLAGQPATFQTFPALGPSASPMLPADLDGATPPPAGAPNYFVRGGGTLGVYRFKVDWATPANSTWTKANELTVAGFTELCPTTGACVPQSGTTQKLDGLGDRLMFRLAYRNFGTHESLVSTQTVNAGSGRAGLRWYEIRTPGTTPTLYQQGTYAPGTEHRWMGSIAQDKNGNTAIGYSVSSSTMFPSIRFAGRAPSDALGTLGQGEGTLYTGTGFQSGVERWGDYAALTVDPVDDCTFWFTTEYNNSGGWAWRTRIGSFKFANCTSGPVNTPTNTPIVATATRTNTPVAATATRTNTPIVATATRTNTPVPATATRTPTPGAAVEKIINGGFESGATPWVQSSTGGYGLIDTTRPRTGLSSVYAGDYDSGTDTIYQTLTVPANGVLTYWWYMITQETGTTAYDKLQVQITNGSGTVLATPRTWSNASGAGVWRQDTISLASYGGQTVRVQFKITTDSTLPTGFFVDDVSVK